jgi:predicted MFS family arabinose efflux permease
VAAQLASQMGESPTSGVRCRRWLAGAGESMRSQDTKGAQLALVVGHTAGMMDIVALPVWVGVLIAGYGYSPAPAGGLVTLFLGGVVISSVLLSPVFHRVPGRWMPAAGFLTSAVALFVVQTRHSYVGFAIGHAIAGLATGIAISFVHGTMARTANPHRVFAMGGLTLGLFAVAFFAAAPALVAKEGPSTLFMILSLVMATGALVTAALFPKGAENEDIVADKAAFSHAVWFAIFGIMCMALVHAMMFSFVERIGADRGYALGMIQRALMLSGIVAVTPSICAALLEKKISPIHVGIAGALLQAIFAMTVSWSSSYPAYLAGTIALPFVMLFTHTFMFGHLARIEPTGRANAATPAMNMTGSATGPLLGGVLVQTSGYQALGVTAVIIGTLAMLCYLASRKQATQL